MEITTLTYLSYMMLPGEQWRSPLSDYYMRIAEQGGGTAYALTDGGSIRAYAILQNESRGSVLSYVYTDVEQRRKGYAHALLQELMRCTEGYLRIHIVRTHPCFDAIYHMAAKAEFLVNDISCVYTYPAGKALWQRMDELMLPRMKEFVLRDGSKCLPFDESGTDVMQQLLHSTENSFGNTLNPVPFLQHSAAGLDTHLSTAMIGADGALRAYSLVTRPTAGTVCFEQIAETESEIGSGAIVAPLCASLEAIRAVPEITKLTLTISERNTRSRNFVAEILKGQELHTLRNYSFILPARSA